MLVPNPINTPGIDLYLWKIDESPDELVKILEQESSSSISLPSIKAVSKQQEWLIERILIHRILGKTVVLSHQENGAPVLEGCNKYISISHTKDYVLLGLSDNPHFGIDIEHISDRVNKVLRHFLNDDEKCNSPELSTRYNLLLWSAKESIFKALRNGVVNNMKDIHISPFQIDVDKSFSATINNNGLQQKAKVQYSYNDNFVLTVATLQE